jgi:hypothetical protein
MAVIGPDIGRIAISEVCNASLIAMARTADYYAVLGLTYAPASTRSDWPTVPSPSGAIPTIPVVRRDR